VHNFRITKYNPKFRDDNDVFTNDEWTSYYDIGETFSNSKFTLADYIKWEKKYMDAIHIIMKANNIEYLKVSDLEKCSDQKHENFLESHIIEFFNILHDNMNVFQKDIDKLFELILREIVWCKLSSESMVVHFGYDYYMYIDSNSALDAEKNKIKNLGLFVENKKSPY